MSFTFSKQKEVKIYVKDLIIESIKLAVNSLLSNIEDIFSKPSLVEEESEADIIIKMSPLTHEEEFVYQIKDNKIYINGNDDLGVIFGIYSLLENELKIPPCYLMEGLTLVKKDSLAIEDKVVNEYPHTKFRGWFVNDEDLLTNFKYEGDRDIDYEFYRHVIHPDMMERIAETCLRYRMNLIIPSTLIDITSPYEENLVRICSRRGLYISQHHIEPMGVSKFGFAKYVKDHGYENYFSYVSNKQAMLDCWDYYAKRWAKYPRVVWQLGLRGGTDTPVWKTDKGVGTTNAERGALISGAIKAQYEIIEKNYTYPIYSTSTLWMEGAILLGTGDIKLPSNTMVIFSDIGMSQLFGDDFFTVKREQDRKYGIYYHSAYWHTGPHLAEGVWPEKFSYCYELTREYNTDYYSVLNVANIKEHMFSIYINSKLTWYKHIDLKDIYDSYASLYVKGDKKDLLINAIKTYYKGLGDIGEKQYYNFTHKYDFSYHKFENLPFPVVTLNDGDLRCLSGYFYFDYRWTFVTPRCREVVEEGIPFMNDAVNQFEKVLDELPEEYKIGYSQHWLFQSKMWTHLLSGAMNLYDANILVREGKGKESKPYYEKTLSEYKEILNDREKYYVGEYKTWFKGDGKINIPACIKTITNEMEEKTK